MSASRACPALITLAVTISGVHIASTCGAIAMQQPGYTVTLVADLPNTADYPTITLDAAGNILVPAGNAGILKVSGQTVTTWSTAKGYDLTLLPSGDGYLAGVNFCNCIQAINSSGAYSPLHQDAFPWQHVALTSSGTLYAVEPVSTGKGIYSVDRTSGGLTPVVAGGLGAGGSGSYHGIVVGFDDKLYVIASLTGSDPWNIYRMDGSQAVSVANLPHGGADLALGPAGNFLVSTAFDYGSGFPTGELYLVDPVTGSSTLLAQSTSQSSFLHPTLGGVAYDPATANIYVTEGFHLWSIKKDGTPARSQSWGALKAMYRNHR